MLLVVCEPVGVETLTDRRVAWLAFLVLVEDPLERRAVTQSVLPRLGGDALQRRLLVQGNDTTFIVGTQYGPRGRYTVLVEPLQRPRLCRLKPDVQVQ